MIIPVYRPDEKLDAILKSLCRQVAQPRHILLLVTIPEKHPEEAEALVKCLAEKDARIRTFTVAESAYDHAATRNMGVRETEEGAELFLLMTQDAVPADDHLTERLAAAFADPKTAAAYARQLTGTDASVAEKCARRFNYPAESLVKTIDDLPVLGIKTFFCSNVCAMYRRDVFEKTGGFEAPAIFNEDMVYASRILHEGYAIRYQADAQVVHAHAYGLKAQFKRSFDNGASQAIRRDAFEEAPPAKEGGRYVRETIRTLLRVRQGSRIPYFVLQCAFRYAGFFFGKRYRSLPNGLKKAFSMNKNYWRKAGFKESKSGTEGRQ
ncbi:MAG: glycosyltransferase family 2 protein [Lachnospiraceae bacterium]|nr:glycosyltransferase family 2 protein [Lachnospiraceae bacterium]